ncbi:MAG TPA: MFS transporter [Turneriella sp.]|nr:MFS transporter [Turneriella sp.]HNE18454.1 MFS transporter [Turneriella sp.]HNN00819.1 MFS transporter [Turneriella sp.]
MQHITRTIWLVSLVSLFTDIASEMLYPVMPIYLQTIGFSIVYIGLLEGIAEATAGLSKGFFGRWSDATGKRVPFVRAGYLLSALAKPLIVAAAQPLWVFFCRTADRLGKGVRTGARDALLSAETDPAHKGKVFGFHRGMDTLGAAIGPALALLWLWQNPGRYHELFLFAFLPGLMAIALTYLLKEKASQAKVARQFRWWDFLRYYTSASVAYRHTVKGLLLFTLFNSSDVFLLLVLKWRGFTDQQVIGVYIFYNLVYAVFSYPMGRLGDTIGLKKTFLAGLLVFILVYTGITFARDFYALLTLFFAYGIYAAMTEGISKAWITNLCNKEDTATAVGTYTAFASLATMLASFAAGLIWKFVSPEATFLVAAAGAGIAGVYLVLTPPPAPPLLEEGRP